VGYEPLNGDRAFVFDIYFQLITRKQRYPNERFSIGLMDDDNCS
jgi:hypothetical protein